MKRIPFVKRDRELGLLDEAREQGGLVVVFGRRRIGKTRMLCRWIAEHNGLYSQAIETGFSQQVRQTYHDIVDSLDVRIEPENWTDFFELLAAQKERWIFCLDEFPYLVASDPSLPSRLQKWLDHDMPPGCLLILAGSSRTMMHQLFLNRSAPLFGRALRIMQVGSMDYHAFCVALGLRPDVPESFEKFACVGGVPKYWEFCESRQSVTELADSLYFDFAPYMEHEPHRMLGDEGIAGQNALSVLEAIGRGAERPSEIARRLGIPQTNLSRLFQQLLDGSVLMRELPFGESLRSTKRIFYRIEDPALRFCFRVYSPHRSLWHGYSEREKRERIHQHAATVFEDWCRDRVTGARRYWEKDLEIDFVAPLAGEGDGLLVAEVKWRRLSAAQRRKVERDLVEKWKRSTLAKRHGNVVFKVFDAGELSA